jgi:hypothetical protein
LEGVGSPVVRGRQGPAVVEMSTKVCGNGCWTTEVDGGGRGDRRAGGQAEVGGSCQDITQRRWAAARRLKVRRAAVDAGDRFLLRYMTT